MHKHKLTVPSEFTGFNKMQPTDHLKYIRDLASFSLSEKELDSLEEKAREVAHRGGNYQPPNHKVARKYYFTLLEKFRKEVVSYRERTKRVIMMPSPEQEAMSA